MRIGFAGPASPGHINPITALARELQARGHQPIYFALPDIADQIQATGIEVCPFSSEHFKAGELAEQLQTMAQLEGAAATRYAFDIMANSSRDVIADGPRVIRESRVEALVLDAVPRNLDLVAMHLGIPYVHVNCALHPDHTRFTPLYVYDWPHEPGPEARARNVAGVQALAPMLEPFQTVVKEYVEQTGLPLDLTDPYAAFSKTAQLTQTPKEFDFPSEHWPPHFHYTGPWHQPAFRSQVPFPLHRLTGEPLIYASMGTLLNGSREVFRTIVEAAYAPGRQIVLSIGAHLTSEELGTVPPNAIVVNHAPQLEILQRAHLCITHAGLNTVLEALAQGVPLVAIPVAYVSARCSRSDQTLQNGPVHAIAPVNR